MLDANTAIEVKNISKIYRIGTKDEMQDNFAQTVFQFIKNPWKNYLKYRSLYQFDDVDLQGDDRPEEENSNIIWAVKNVSFDVEKGEVLGIIGRNGAGKSTLLKILCRITDPTNGRVKIRGRISSLLEVGTGFHPELTGRENVYLNGTILGMTKAEVVQRFDEIVHFSGIEKFIDTPVKRYSSGMRVRLAFSVAAHLEPEILIIDEVLAVGDADFQKKCLNKMEDVGKHGRTVLFVSHNMSAITRLCDRVLLLDSGRSLMDGSPDEVVRQHLKSGQDIPGELIFNSVEKAPGNDIVKLIAISTKQKNGQISPVINIEEPFCLEMKYQVIKPGFTFLPRFHLHDGGGNLLFITFDQDKNWVNRPRPPGLYSSKAWIPGHFLNEGTVYVDASMYTAEPKMRHFKEKSAIAFEVVETLTDNPTRSGFGKKIGGLIRPALEWTTDYEEPRT